MEGIISELIAVIARVELLYCLDEISSMERLLKRRPCGTLCALASALRAVEVVGVKDDPFQTGSEGSGALEWHQALLAERELAAGSSVVSQLVVVFF